MRKLTIIYEDSCLTDRCSIQKIQNLVGDNVEVQSNFNSFNGK